MKGDDGSLGCVMGCIKYLLFIFNFLCVICGLAILIVGIVIHLNIGHAGDELASSVAMPAITLIVIGSIIFVISFFGCCGAIRESHCMMITFACLLLVILIVQVAVGIYVLVASKNTGNDPEILKNQYTQIFDGYYKTDGAQTTVDSIQLGLMCCGIDSARDYSRFANTTVPGSCCGKSKGETCETNKIYQVGCLSQIKDVVIWIGSILGGIALGVAAVELCGIIFALCLANSIKNTERRGYRV